MPWCTRLPTAVGARIRYATALTACHPVEAEENNQPDSPGSTSWLRQPPNAPNCVLYTLSHRAPKLCSKESHRPYDEASRRQEDSNREEATYDCAARTDGGKKGLCVVGDAHHRVGEEGAHHQTEDGEGAGVRAHRGEGGRLGVGHGAFLAQSFGPLASRCAHDNDFRPENDQNCTGKLRRKAGHHSRQDATVQYRFIVFRPVQQLSRPTNARPLHCIWSGTRKEGQSGLDVNIAVIRNTQYAIRNACQKYAIRKLLKNTCTQLGVAQYLGAYGVSCTDARIAHTFAGPIAVVIDGPSVATRTHACVRRASRSPTLDDDSNQS